VSKKKKQAAFHERGGVEGSLKGKGGAKGGNGVRNFLSHEGQAKERPRGLKGKGLRGKGQQRPSHQTKWRLRQQTESARAKAIQSRQEIL